MFHPQLVELLDSTGAKFYVNPLTVESVEPASGAGVALMSTLFFTSGMRRTVRLAPRAVAVALSEGMSSANVVAWQTEEWA